MTTPTARRKPPFRILIVDDNPTVHDAFDRILRRDVPDDALKGEEALLFGQKREAETVEADYALVHAMSGQEAIDKLRAAKAEDQPHQIAFVDIRMPGMDGVKTIEHLWQLDANIQTVICTAYADYRWQDLAERFGRTDRLLVLKKPFHDLEVMQLASTLTQKWALAKQAAMKVDQMETLIAQRTQKLLELQNLEQQRLREVDQAKIRALLQLSQEFRTPLTMLLNVVEDMTDGTKLDPSKKELAQRSLRTLLSLVDESALIRRAEDGEGALQVKSCEMGIFLRGLLDGFAARGRERGVEWRVSGSSADDKINTDPARLEKALFSLFLWVLEVAADKSQIIVQWGIFDGRAAIDIKLPHATSQKENITLLFAREILRPLRGTISCQKDGSALRIVVELQSCEMEAVVEAAHAETEPDGKEHPMLLMAGESVELRAFVRDGMSPEFGFMEASAGDEMADAAREHVPDAIIIDCNGFRGDPIAVCSRLKTDEVTSHIPIVLLGASISESSQVRALEAGVDDFLDKPFRLPLLKARVTSLLENRRKLHERFHSSAVIVPREIASNQIDAQFLNRVAEIVEANLTDYEFEVETLARRLGVSRRQLFRKFRAIAGCTPNVFIREIRLKRAAKLLEESSMTISEIIYAVGFSDPKHFRTVFRERFGVLPGEYGKKQIA